MNPPRLIAGLAAIVALVIVGYFLLSDRESPSPVSVEIAQGDSAETAAAEDGANNAPAAESAQPSAAAAAQPGAKPEPAPETAEAQPAETKAVVSETGESKPRSTETAALQTPAVIPKSESGKPAAKPGLVLPSFDVVRVEPSGETVIAGRTTPRSLVTLYDGTVALGSVTADSAGQWVLVLDTPLAPGTHELSLEAKSTDGGILLSANVVVVSVPQPRVAAASQPAQTQPAQTQPAQTQPAQTQPAQTQPAQTQPAQTQPAQTQPAQTQPAQTQPAQTQPAQTQPAQTQPAQTQPAQTQPAETQLAETQLAETQLAETQLAETQLAVTQPATERPTAPAALDVQQAATDQPATVQPAATAAQGGAQAGTLAQEPKASQVAAMPAGEAVPVPEAQPDQPLAVLMPRSGGGIIRILQQPESLNRGLGEDTLILESVDYDAAGHTTIGGRAEPGARLIVYLDGKPLGQITAGAGGRWQITLDQPVSQGLHRFRVDQVDASGRVVARVETPFSRAAMVASLPDQTSVIVQPGNSLWRIARRIYGEGPRFSVIYQANKDQIREPDLIYPGQIFVVPVAN